MLLHLSHFRLNSYAVLVVSKQKGIALVFKTDLLQNDVERERENSEFVYRYKQTKVLRRGALGP